MLEMLMPVSGELCWGGGFELRVQAGNPNLETAPHAKRREGFDGASVLLYQALADAQADSGTTTLTVTMFENAPESAFGHAGTLITYLDHLMLVL